LWADHLVSGELNSLAIESLELHWLRAECLLKSNSVVVDEVVALASHLLSISTM
jgi:hypothetical protein